MGAATSTPAQAGKAKAAAGTAQAGSAAAKAKAAAMGVAKVAGTKGAFVAGAAFMARRVTWPILVLGTAFGSAAWFGVFEVALGLTKYVIPVPAKRDENAHLVGFLTVPLIVGTSAVAGWRFSPAMPDPPSTVFDASGWVRYIGRFPYRYVGAVGVGSAFAAAVGCRALSGGHAR